MRDAHLVRCLLDEVFGSENFLSSIAFVKGRGSDFRVLASTSDTILWYAKNKESVKTNASSCGPVDGQLMRKTSGSNYRMVAGGESRKENLSEGGQTLYSPEA